MDVQIKSKQVLDKCEAMSLLCMNASNYWNTIKTFLQFPLIIINALLCILNSLGEQGIDMKLPNIVINGISVLLLSVQSNLKVAEKVENFKNLGNQFLLLAHSIEGMEGDDLNKYNVTNFGEKYDILQQQCKFEDIPDKIKKNVSEIFNNRTLPFQLKNSNNKTITITSNTELQEA